MTQRANESIWRIDSQYFLQSAKRVYGWYLQLDTDGNGMLSQQELLGYEGAYLTEVVVQRVFEECQTYDGEMDFKSFLDFVLAIENRGTRSAMQVGSATLTFRVGDDCQAHSLQQILSSLASSLPDPPDYPVS